MKHCPQCHEQFGDELAFCDVDGTPLVDDTCTPGSALHKTTDIGGRVNSTSTLTAAVTALAGILIGIMLCLVVYIMFPVSGPNATESQNQNRDTTSTRSTASAQVNQISTAPRPSPSPIVEESPSPEASPATEEAEPAAAASSSNAVVNHGPISTAASRTSNTRILITMKDGSSIQADAAWQDEKDVWYRQGGLVSVVQRAKVEKINDLSSASSTTEAPRP